MEKGKHKQTTIETIEVCNSFITVTYRIPKEMSESYYSQCVQTYLDHVVEAYKQLAAWEHGEIVFAPTPPNYQAMIEEELDILKNLNKYTPRYDFSYIVKNDKYNIGMADVFLRLFDPYPEKQRTATVALERIRWLTVRINETKAPHIIPPLVSEDEDTIMLRQQIEVLDLPNAGTEYYPLLYTLKDAWHAYEKPWAADNAKFTRKIAHILQIDEGTLTRGLNRACELLRIEKKSLECHPLATLEASQINISGKEYKNAELEKWKERLKKIEPIMSLDIAKTLISKLKAKEK